MNPQHNINSSNFSDLLFFLNSQYQNKNQLVNIQDQPTHSPIQNIYTKEINQPNKNLLSDKMNITMSVKERENKEENNPIFKVYLALNNQKSQAVNELNDINEKINENIKEIEEIKTKLINLKKEKNKKKADIVNLLSNKESMEEIYKNQMYILINPYNNENNLGDNNKTNEKLNKDKNNEVNRSSINGNNNHILNNDWNYLKISISDIKDSDQEKYIEQVSNMTVEIFQNNNLEIQFSIVNIIKDSFESLLKNTDENNNNKNDIIIDNIFTKLSILISNHSLGKFQEEKINILLRYLLLINSISKKLNNYIKFVNKKYKEKKIKLNDSISDIEKNNKELHQKINKLDRNIRDYDEKLENLIKNLNFQTEKIAENSAEENNVYQSIDTLATKKEQIEEKEKEQLTPVNSNIKFHKSKENSNEKGIIEMKKNNIINISDNKTNKKDSSKIVGRNKNNIEKEENKNENKLTHEVIIEYEDGIDQNVEINYEANDISNDYNFEKETELINQGINPYNNKGIYNNIIDNCDKQNRIDYLQNNVKDISIINKQNSKDKNEIQKKITNDADESDKNLNNLINNIEIINDNQRKKNNNLIINTKKDSKNSNDLGKKKGNIKYLVIEDDNNNKDILEKKEKVKNDNANNKIKKIKNNFDIYNNNYSRRNHNRSNHKLIEIKERNDNSLNSNIKK